MLHLKELISESFPSLRAPRTPGAECTDDVDVFLNFSLFLPFPFQEELLFYNDDGSPHAAQSVLVERNLRSADLCSVLAVKNRVAKDVHWTLFEHWPEQGLGKCRTALRVRRVLARPFVQQAALQCVLLLCPMRCRCFAVLYGCVG